MGRWFFFSSRSRHTSFTSDWSSDVCSSDLVVRRNIKLAECPSFGKTIFDYEPNCHGADDYQQLAAAIMAQCPRELLKSSDGKPQVSVISKPVAQRVHSV